MRRIVLDLALGPDVDTIIQIVKLLNETKLYTTQFKLGKKIITHGHYCQRLRPIKKIYILYIIYNINTR